MASLAAKPLSENTPDELKSLPQWVCWRYERCRGRETKVPRDPRTGKRADTTNPATWGTFHKALEAYEAGGYAGIGLVFREDDPYAGVDFDDCGNPETGETAEWVLEWVEAFGGYCEISPSGTGLHIIVRGRAPNRHNRGAGVEAYSSARFFSVTGSAPNGEAGSPIPERQDVLDRLCAEFFPAPRHHARPEPTGESRPVAVEDQELLRKARAARRGMGERFAALYDRGEFLEHPSHSEARHELLRHLAFWTAGDAARMDRLYRGSALYAVPGYAQKWDRLAERECRRAIAGTPKVYREGGGSSAGDRSRTEVNEALDRFDPALRSHPWGRWRAGMSITKTLHLKARAVGQMRPDGGVAVDLSQAVLAREAAVSPKTVERYARRIEGTGLVRKANADRKLTEATTWVLIPPPAPPLARDVGTRKGLGNNDTRVIPRTDISRTLPLTRPRLRAPERYIPRLGKSWEALRDELQAADGGGLRYEDAAAALGIRDARHLRRPQPDSWLERAERAGLIRRTSWGIFFLDGWEEREDRARERAGELAADVRDHERYKRLRKDWLSPLPNQEKRPESKAEQAARRDLEDLRKAGAERQRYRRDFKQHTHARARARRGIELRDRFREGFAERRRAAIEVAIARLFAERPEYRGRRVGQITCALPDYLGPDFPRGEVGLPKDREVEGVLDGVSRRAS